MSRALAAVLVPSFAVAVLASSAASANDGGPPLPELDTGLVTDTGLPVDTGLPGDTGDTSGDPPDTDTEDTDVLPAASYECDCFGKFADGTNACHEHSHSICSAPAPTSPSTSRATCPAARSAPAR